jgi:hypothetical protein
MPLTTQRWRCEGIRTSILLAASVALAMLLACGVAFAATVDCGRGDCVGTRSDDTLFGSAQADEEFGLGGGDLMYGYKSADRIRGGRGDDRIFPGEGDDRVPAGAGNDLIYAVDKASFDYIDCGEGFDEVETIHRDDRTLRNCQRALGPPRETSTRRAVGASRPPSHPSS